MKARGLLSIPSFTYYDDARSLYSVLSEFATSSLSTYYTSEASIRSDPQLHAFLDELSASGPGGIPGFPVTSSITSVASLSKIATQVKKYLNVAKRKAEVL